MNHCPKVMYSVFLIESESRKHSCKTKLIVFFFLHKKPMYIRVEKCFIFSLISIYNLIFTGQDKFLYSE